MKQLHRIFFYNILVCLVGVPTLSAHRNVSRYFLFPEQPENYRAEVKPKTTLDTAFFYISSSSAYKRDGGTIGIPELWGKYDLQNVLYSLNQLQPTFNPIAQITGSPKSVFAGASMPFKVDGKTRAAGLSMQIHQPLPWWYLSIGAWIPVMHVNTMTRYSFDVNAFNNAHKTTLTQDQILQADAIRRLTHEAAGFKQNTWQAGGFGDLELYLRWSRLFEHKLLMKSISVCAQGGLLAPTSPSAKTSIPNSLAFMGDRHWGLYLDFIPEFELKQDLRVGLMLGWTHQFSTTEERNIPVFNEPAIYSSLVGRLEQKKGETFKISPYLMLENLTDGLHFQARYCFLAHTRDSWKDKRTDKTIPSFLTLTPSTTITQDDIDQNIRAKKTLSLFRAHSIALQLLYDAKAGLQKWFFDPVFYVNYDGTVLGGAQISNTHQITIGVNLHF